MSLIIIPLVDLIIFNVATFFPMSKENKEALRIISSNLILLLALFRSFKEAKAPIKAHLHAPSTSSSSITTALLVKLLDTKLTSIPSSQVNQFEAELLAAISFKQRLKIINR
jgi:hypothetical protein